MVQTGNHMKVNAPEAARARAREFYVSICGCTELPSPAPKMDLWQFPSGFVVGMLFDDAHALSMADMKKAAWLELKTDDYEGMKARLLEFGVDVVASADTSRLYFQAPGGQVYRLAPIDGGV